MTWWRLGSATVDVEIDTGTNRFDVGSDAEAIVALIVGQEIQLVDSSVESDLVLLEEVLK